VPYEKYDVLGEAQMTSAFSGRKVVKIGVCLALGLALAACQTQQKAGIGDNVQTAWPDAPNEPRFFYEKTIRGSGDIVELTTSERLKAMATGAGPSGANLSKPFGVVIKNGRMFVGDSVSRMVHAFDFKLKKYIEIGTEGAGALAKPLGVAIDGKDRLYVVDATSKRVAIYDFNGKYLGAIDGKRYFNRPTGVAVNDDGSKIFVVDTGGVSSSKHTIHVFDGEGSFLYNIGKRGNGEGELNLPLNATVGPKGLLYVVDGGNFRVQAFDQEGNFKFTLGAVGKRTGQFARPKNVAVDKDGNIYVSDAAFGNVQIFNKDRKLLMWIGSRAATNQPGKFMLPSGLTVDRSDGRIYLVDQFFRKVEVYRPASLGKPDYNKPEK